MALKAHQKSKLHPQLDKLLSPFKRSRVEASDTLPGCQYDYIPLDPQRGQIRLLKIKSGSGLDDTLVCTSRRVVLLEQKRAYNTVSYVWGDATKRAFISVDGKLLDVPQSSEKALRRIRKRDMSIVVWIDAICINQNDMAERSQQVAMMADIYRNGLTNYVILGHNAPESTRSALHCIRLLRAIEIEDATKHGVSFVEAMYNKNGSSRFSSTGLTTDIDQSSLAEFYSLPWFSRLWVLQEVALAKHNVCLFGEDKVELEHVLIAAKWLVYKTSFLDAELIGHDGMINASTMFTFTDSPHSARGSGYFTLTISAVLNNAARRLSCEDPRDKIYATIGLVDWSEHGGLPPEFAPDYSRSVEEVLTLAASWIIKSDHRRSFSFLHDVSHESNEDIHLDGLPSWVPRWHSPSLHRLRIRRAPDFSERQSSVKQSTLGVATSSRWIVNGIRIDVMQEVASTRKIRNLKIFAEDYVKPLQRFLDLSNLNMDRDVSGVILCGDTWADGTPLSKHNRQQIRQWLDEGLNSTAGFSETRLEECATAILDTCTGRSVALTRFGLPCLVPRITTAGDIVVWISGSAYPTILRPCGDNYEVIGQAYMHGIMDGEAIEAWKASGVEIETFSLI